ncbi:MAG: hypothetical protein Kow0069_13260 [Promethearchaeota archaeon]
MGCGLTFPTDQFNEKPASLAWVAPTLGSRRVSPKGWANGIGGRLRRLGHPPPERRRFESVNRETDNLVHALDVHPECVVNEAHHVANALVRDPSSKRLPTKAMAVLALLIACRTWHYPVSFASLSRHVPKKVRRLAFRRMPSFSSARNAPATFSFAKAFAWICGKLGISCKTAAQAARLLRLADKVRLFGSKPTLATFGEVVRQLCGLSRSKVARVLSLSERQLGDRRGEVETALATLKRVFFGTRT